MKSMQIGIFAKTFLRPTLAENLDAIVAHGLSVVQFNLSCAGLPSMPDTLEAETASAIRDEFAARGLTMAAVSGTFNMIHPDLEKRRAGMERLRVLAEACEALGASIITLCTGTRDPDNMWRWHPDNDTPAAWGDLIESMGAAVKIAEMNNVILAIEPEPANVIDRASKGRRLLDGISSAHLKVVMDGANLFHPGDLSRTSQAEVFEEAFSLLGQDIVLAHAKDLTKDGEAGQLPAGKGALDYDLYLKGLKNIGFDGPLILHGLAESEVRDSVAFLRSRLS